MARAGKRVCWLEVGADSPPATKRTGTGSPSKNPSERVAGLTPPSSATEAGENRRGKQGKAPPPASVRWSAWLGSPDGGPWLDLVAQQSDLCPGGDTLWTNSLHDKLGRRVVTADERNGRRTLADRAIWTGEPDVELERLVVRPRRWTWKAAAEGTKLVVWHVQGGDRECPIRARPKLFGAENCNLHGCRGGPNELKLSDRGWRRKASDYERNA